MQSSKFGMKKLHLFLQKRAFTARAMIKYLSIYMHLIIFSSFANSSTDITHFKGVGSDVVSVSCFGVRFSVMFHFMFVHYTFSSVWVPEWPPFGK